jgi:hypothetical protein
MQQTKQLILDVPIQVGRVLRLTGQPSLRDNGDGVVTFEWGDKNADGVYCARGSDFTIIPNPNVASILGSPDGIESAVMAYIATLPQFAGTVEEIPEVEPIVDGPAL